MVVRTDLVARAEGPDANGALTTENLRRDIEEIRNEVELREHAQRNG